MGLGAVKTERFDDGGVMRVLMKCRRSLWAVVLGIIVIVCTATFASAAGGDQGKIVFVSDRTGSWQIYTMNPDGSDLFQVTNLAPPSDDGLFPTISPDGKQILFNYSGPDGVDLYVINVDGTGLQALTQDHQSFFGHWSPDGKKVAFTTASSRGPAVIAVMQADGTGERQILTTDLWDSVAPLYTPDGKQIVFQSQMGGYVSAVWIMNSDGSHQRRLTAPALKGAASAVSPDGKHILVLNNLNSPPALPNENFVMKLNGSGLKRLAPLAQFHHDLWATYSPDGKKISFVSDRFSNDITEFTYGTFDILTMDANGANILDIAPGVGFCPFDGNCVDASWGVSAPQ
jgi:Tol biopolymer transport system component